MRKNVIPRFVSSHLRGRLITANQSISEDATEQLPKPGLRVGVLVDGMTQPRWKYEILSGILKSEYADIVVLAREQSGALIPPDSLSQLWRNRRELFYSLYRKVDNLLFRATPDAFEAKDLNQLELDCPIIEMDTRQAGAAEYFAAKDIDRLVDSKLDVLLQLSSSGLQGDILQVARHGVWSYHFGESPSSRTELACFWEVMTGSLMTRSVLQQIKEKPEDCHILYRSYASTDKKSVRRNCNNVFWKSSEFVARCLRDLHATGEVPSVSNSGGFRPNSDRSCAVPTNSMMVRMTSRIAAKYAREKCYDLQSRGHWTLFYQIEKENSAELAPQLDRFERLVSPKDRFWADPFVWYRDGKHYIFFEELIYQTNKGHISVFVIDSDGKVSPSQPVLVTDYHLSYPFLFEWEGELYMIPETRSNKTIEIHKCLEFPHKWELHETVFDNVEAVDATLYDDGRRWWMFVGMPVSGASSWDELHLYYADSPFGPWTPHPRNPVKSDVRSARPAGNLFRWNGQLIRPAQDCGPLYGYAINFNKILQLDPETYEEESIGRILPSWDESLLGTHTINRAKGLTVVDGFLRRSKWR